MQYQDTAYTFSDLFLDTDIQMIAYCFLFFKIILSVLKYCIQIVFDLCNTIQHFFHK